MTKTPACGEHDIVPRSSCAGCYRALLMALTESERSTDEALKLIGELQREVAWWAGEGQETRPEIIEWRALVAVPVKQRTVEDANRIREIAGIIERENENEPELRAHNEVLTRALREIVEGRGPEAIKGIEGGLFRERRLAEIIGDIKSIATEALRAKP